MVPMKITLYWNVTPCI